MIGRSIVLNDYTRTLTSAERCAYYVERVFHQMAEHVDKLGVPFVGELSARTVVSEWSDDDVVCHVTLLTAP